MNAVTGNPQKGYKGIALQYQLQDDEDDWIEKAS